MSICQISYNQDTFRNSKDAQVSIFDRGYLFADGVYEVTAVIHGKLVDFKRHIKRLNYSLQAMSIKSRWSDEQIEKIHLELIEKNHLTEGTIYMQITRGVAPRIFQFPEESAAQLTAFAMTGELLNNPHCQKGVRVITTPDIRWQRRDIKSIALLGQVLVKQEAVGAGAFEGWMVEDNYVREGSSSAALILSKGVIQTHELCQKVLASTTRNALLDIARECDLQVVEKAFTLEDAYAADEAFLSSASNLILPVVTINQTPVGSGKPGKIFQLLRQKYIERYCS